MCGNTFTCGGVKITADAEVVNRDGAVIPGLYAAGETTGLYYTLYVGATSVLRGLVFGRQAGRKIGAELGPKEVQRGLGDHMTNRDANDDLKRLLTHHEIAERLAIWCRSVDARDFATLSQVFHPEVIWDFGQGIVDRNLAQLITRIEAHMLGASYCGARHIHVSNLCTRAEGRR